MRRWMAWVWLLPFLAVLGAPAYAQGSAVLFLAPSSGTISQNGLLNVVIKLDSGAEDINTVQANLSYDDSKLEYISASETGSNFGLQAQTQGGAGVVKIARGNLKPLKGVQVVTTLTFKAKAAEGTTTIEFKDGSLVIRPSDVTNILGSTQKGIYSFTAVAATPASSNPPWLVIVLGVSLALAAGGVGFVLWRRGRTPRLGGVV